MAYVSAEPKVDRDRLLKGELLEKVDADELWKRPFRNMFITERDVQIVDVIFNYFSSIKARWPIAWANNDKGNMLNRTNGFRAFMRAFQHVHILHGTPSGVVPRAFMDEFMRKVPLDDRAFNTDNFKPGSAGESALLSVLRDVR